MNLLLNRKKGAVLLQTLILVVILTTIAVMVIKWNMGRYTLVNRIANSFSGTVRTQGYAAKNQMIQGQPPDSSGTVDGKKISFTGNPSVSGMRRYKTTVQD